MDLNEFYGAFRDIASLSRYHKYDDAADLNVKAIGLIEDALKKYDNIVGFVSKSKTSIPEPKDCGSEDKVYLMIFHAIDGMHNVVTNVTTGSIYMLVEYDVNKDCILNVAEAGYCIYGASTVLVTAKEKSVVLHVLGEDGAFHKERSLDCIGDEKLYSLNEAYSLSYDTDIQKIVKYYKTKNYNNRWVGSMVSDCHQILLRGGMFMYPHNLQAPTGKISLIYKALPFCYIFEQLGGSGLNNNYKKITDRLPHLKLRDCDLHGSVPLFLCSATEYSHLKDIMSYLNLDHEL
eukprot:m.57768 g.57768  ORF g.57768 m.57768 type:complete len:290 (+) comp15620_c0_seq1:74-943(+)